jgi:hypothetical protein
MVFWSFNVHKVHVKHVTSLSFLNNPLSWLLLSCLPCWHSLYSWMSLLAVPHTLSQLRECAEPVIHTVPWSSVPRYPHVTPLCVCLCLHMTSSQRPFLPTLCKIETPLQSCHSPPWHSFVFVCSTCHHLAYIHRWNTGAIFNFYQFFFHFPQRM